MVLHEVLFEDGQKLQWLLVFLPNTLGLSHVMRFQFLMLGWIALQLPSNPLDCALLVADKKFHLLDLSFLDPFKQ